MMKYLTATICLTIAVFLFNPTDGWSLPSCAENEGETTWNNCEGELIAPSGNRYVGVFRDGLFHGTHSSGNEYFGQYKNGMMHGQGSANYFNGDRYVGEWKDGRKYGQGTYTFVDGTVQSGTWADDEFVQAVESQPVETEKQAEDLSEDIGEISDCRIVNPGKYKDDGFTKDGLWVEYYPDGQFSIGTYKNGYLEGPWIAYWGNCQLQTKGNFKNGQREGSWIMYWEDGRLWYKGDFKNGKEEGFWIFYNRNGTVEESGTGTYKDGVRIFPERLDDY